MLDIFNEKMLFSNFIDWKFGGEMVFQNTLQLIRLQFE